MNRSSRQLKSPSPVQTIGFMDMEVPRAWPDLRLSHVPRGHRPTTSSFSAALVAVGNRWAAASASRKELPLPLQTRIRHALLVMLSHRHESLAPPSGRLW